MKHQVSTQISLVSFKQPTWICLGSQSQSQVSISTRKRKHTPAFVTDESSKYSQLGIKYLGVIELSDSEDEELDDLVYTWL